MIQYLNEKSARANVFVDRSLIDDHIRQVRQDGDGNEEDPGGHRLSLIQLTHYFIKFLAFAFQVGLGIARCRAENAIHAVGHLRAASTAVPSAKSGCSGQYQQERGRLGSAGDVNRAAREGADRDIIARGI